MSDANTGREVAAPIGNLNMELGTQGLPPSLQILLNEGVYERIKQLAGVMSRAQGFTPDHLLGKPEACFTVINIALDARLNPHFTARHTYQTPGGSIGFDGALVQAMLEQSGRFVGSPEFEYRGDWSKVTGKFRLQAGRTGKEFPVRTWTDDDAIGCGIIIRWLVRGEKKPRVWPGEDTPFWLTQCYPLNSPLWATDPRTQIAYLVIRRFANQVAPGILGAAAYDEAQLLDASERAIDVTPEPQRASYVEAETQSEDETQHYSVVDGDGEAHSFGRVDLAVQALQAILQEAARAGVDMLDGAWESNQPLLEALDEEQGTALGQEYADLREDARRHAAPGLAAVQNQGMKQDQREQNSEPQEAPDPTSAPADTATKTATTPQEPSGGAAAAKTEQDRVPEQQSAPSQQSAETPAPSPNAVQGREPSDDRFPGDLPAGEKLGDKPAERTVPRRPTQAAAAKPGTTAASPSDERPSKRVAIPAGGIRIWWIALMGPKVRRERDPNELAWLIGDNEQTFEQARHPGAMSAEELAEMERTIKEAWDRCSPPT